MKWEGAVRDLVIAGEIKLGLHFMKCFTVEELQQISADLEMVWLRPKHHRRLRELRYYIKYLQDQMDNSKWAKPAEFEGEFRLIRVVNFTKENGEKVGAKFTDKWGNISRLTFRDAEIEDGKLVDKSGDRTLDVASYGFALDFKNAKIPAGAYALVMSLSIQNPLDPSKSYRRWIFQFVASGEKPLPVVSAEPQETNGDTSVDLGNEDSGQHPF